MTFDRILVTGGAGFIGSHLVDALLENEVKVRVLDDLSSGSFANLTRWKNNRNMKVARGSVINYRKVRALAENTDAIIHLAAVVSPVVSMRHPESTNSVNVAGTMNILRAGLAAETKRVVYASSSSVYGNVPSHRISETAPLNPITPYGVSKLAAEKYCQAFYSAYGLSTVSLRYFNVYGERQLSNPYSGVIAIFASRLFAGLRPQVYGDGKQIRDFIHVSDVVRATLLALEENSVRGKTLNVGTGKPTTINKLATTVAALAGKRNTRPTYTAPRPGDIRKSCADISMATKVLGFRPKTTLRHGLRQLIESMRNQS